MDRQIEVKKYCRKFSTPLRTAKGEWSIREGFILRITDNRTGSVTYSEVAPIPEFGSETITEAAKFLAKVAKNPLLACPDSLPCCQFALSMAELKPKQSRAGEGETLSVCALLPAGDQAISAMAAKSEKGFATFKWKIGVLPVEKEIELAKSLFGTLPENGRLRLDANASLSVGELEKWLEFLEGYIDWVDFIEQPLAVGLEREMSQIADSSRVSIALDESLNGATGRRILNTQSWSGVYVMKPLLAGNLQRLVQNLKPIADRVVLSSVFETAVGYNNALEVAQAIGGLRYPIGFDTIDAFKDDLKMSAETPGQIYQTRNLEKLGELWKSI